MAESMEPMKIALRVLTALADKHEPQQSDIDALSRFAGPRPPEQALDEYACDALQLVLKDRAAARRVAGAY